MSVALRVPRGAPPFYRELLELGTSHNHVSLDPASPIVAFDSVVVPSAFGGSFKFCGSSNLTVILYSDASPSDQQNARLLFCSQVALHEA